MRRIIAFFVRQPLFADLLTITICVLGIASAFLIQRETFPNVNFDILQISTIFPGATPDDTEKLITNPLEQDLREVDGIKKMLSTSIENMSLITVFLDPDQTTEQKGKQDVEDVVDKFVDLPKGAEDPTVTSLESKNQPMIEVAMAGDRDPMEMRRLAKFLEAEIEQISGIARVVHRGLRNLEVHVEPDILALSKFRVSLDELIAALSKQNISIPAGIIEANSSQANSSLERFVRTVGEFRTIEDIENTVVRSNDLGRPILVKDLAQVKMGLERPTIINRSNGRPSLTLTVLKKEHTDVINLSKEVREKVESLKPKLGPDIDISYVNDLSVYVKNRLGILTSNMALGLFLVLVLLPLFMPFRFSMIIALGEPFAFLGTIWLFYNFDISINLLTMIGLIIVSGILVDDSIVVTENAARLVEKGMDPKDAAIKGTRQIVAPVIASLLTTSAAFAPMMFMSGIFGKFVMYIPLAVIIALLVSMLECFFVMPAHIATWITPDYVKRIRSPDSRNKLEAMTKAFQRFWDSKVADLYVRWLKRFVHHRYWVALSLIVLLCGSLLLATKGMRFILFPPEGVEIFFIRTEAPTGTSLESHANLIRPVEKLIEKLPKEELDNFTSSVGLVQQDPNDPNTRRGSEYAQIAVYLTPETDRKRTAAEIIEDLRLKVGEPKGLNKITFNRLNPGPPTGKPVSLSVRASNYEDALPVVAELKQILGTIKGVTDISDSYYFGKEEVQIKVNAAEAAAAGLSVAAIGNTVRAVYEGIVATTMRELDDEIDVRVMFPEDQRASRATLDQVLIPNPQGALIPLSRIANTSSTRGLAFHDHEGQSRQIRVTADIDQRLTSSLEVNGKLKDFILQINAKYPAATVVFGGEDEDTQESFQSLGRAFAVAVLGIMLILVMTFKSLLQPLVVLVTIPIGVIAVILAFFVHGMPLSFLGMMGVIALSGVIVNNAIVMVDFVNQARLEGMDRFESIFRGARDRLRPIFLTTATTVIGVLPTAYGIGGLDKFVVPIAMALGWGIAFGSIMTAFFFPAILAILDDIEGYFKK